MVLFDSVASAARAQHGVVTTAQLLAGGLGPGRVRTLVANGVLRRAAPGVLTVTTSPDCWERRLMIAVLASGAGAVASHRSAAALWRLDRFRPGHLDITIARGRRRPPSGWRLHEAAVLPSSDVRVVRSLPTTSPTRTLIDMGRYASAHRLGRMVDDAVRRDLTSYETLHRHVDELGRRGRNGISTVRSALASRPGGAVAPDSALENDIRQLLLRSGIDEPVLHHRVDCGELTYVLDLAWPERLVALECDGFRFHRTPAQLDWDDRRRNELGLRGWLVLHGTWRRLNEDPSGLVGEVRRSLDDRGATGR